MNSTNPHDADRDALAQAWYNSLLPFDKREVDDWTHNIFMTLHVNPQSKFSTRMALEIAFMAVVYSVYGPMDERMQ